MRLTKQKYLLSAAAIALAVPVASSSVLADATLDAVLQRLEKLEKENAKLKNEMKKIENKGQANAKANANAKAAGVKGMPMDIVSGPNTDFVQVSMPRDAYGVGAPLPAGDDDWFFRKKPGSRGLTFQTPNGEITLYGRLNMTIQDTTPGTAGFNCLPAVCNPANNPGASFPVGNMGWMPSIGSSNSYIGLRGEQKLGDLPFKFVYQLETTIDLEATAGVAETNSKLNNTVQGALTSRNSYIGLASGDWGAIKAGKTTTPYANSTQIMNPFSGMLGNYTVIMSNTGGDNRAEFAGRLDHALWYESPQWKVANGTFAFQALWSPGQNRADNSDNIPAGESECTGGNSPVSGGFTNCSDGSFSDAYSVAATYQTKIDNVGVLVTAGYERHMRVNRSSDLLAEYGVSPFGPNFNTFPFISPINLPTPLSQKLYSQDVADEDAAKVGAQFSFASGTTVSAIFERMHRYVPADLEFQNERQGNRTWLSITQDIGEKQTVAFGWGHAFRAPGDPCQHSDCFLLTPDGAAYAPNHNGADMFTLAYSYRFHPGWTWFIDYAITVNESSAHFDLAQGGGAATTDCHDASSAIGGVGAPLPGPGFTNPHCWTGGILQGIQTGIRYQF